MELTILIVACLLIGFFAGFMSGMFGIGGGSIRTPLLYAAGLPLLSAFGINLLVIPFSSCIAAISHRKNIDWKFAPYVVIGGTIGSVIGAFLAGVIQTIILAIIFVIVSLITVFGIYLDRAAPKLAQKINPNAKFILGGTFFLNFITAMRGGSGGSLFPPFLKAMRLDMHRAIATSLFATIFTAIGAVIIYWYRGDIILLPAVVVIIGSMAGARIGSSISLKTKSLWLEIGLSIFVIILALIVVFKALLIQ
jgi:uncharacterized membrane protein YfcA